MKIKMNKKIIKIFILFSLISLFLAFSFTLAQERKLELEYPEVAGLKPETVQTDLPEYVRYIFNLAILAVGLILFGVIIWGGILYLISTGQPAKLKEAKDRILAGFLGTILLLSSYIILTTINPQLAIFKLPLLEKIVKPPEYRLSEYKPEEITQIFHEIPLGQLLENGLWEKERTNKLKALLLSFEKFLKQEIKVGEEKSDRISNLNKYLITLTESCHCEELTGICQKAKNFSWPIACIGDPCEKVRKEINNVLKINEKKSKELSAYKEKITEIKNIFEDEGRKFRNLMEVLEHCKKKGLLTRAEYYDSLAFLEEQGGKTKLIKSHLPAKADDPLVFYCSVGGTIYDYPYALPQISLEETELAREFMPEPAEAGEPLSCAAEIPIGEMLSETLEMISYEANSNLEDLIYYIEKLLAELTNMTELISQCNESRCNVSCACIPNPCFLKCAPPPNPCSPFCKSPCLQAVGGCHGEPCPRQKIIETSERIKIYEDEIFSLLDWTKGDIEDAEFVLEGEENPIDLKTIRAWTQTCLSLGAPKTREKPEEEPFWALLRCDIAIGNKGPDGNPIILCHPQNFFCCTTKPPSINPFPSMFQKRKPEVTTPLPDEPYSPSEFYNKVPHFSQYDERWKSQSFGCGKTIGQAGCGPTSMAMSLNYFGSENDPPSVADWVLKNGYRICGKGTAHKFCCKAPEILGKEKGLKCKSLHGNVKEVLNEIKNGKNKVAVVSSRGAPPYTKGGHYIVLTGIEKEWNEEFVLYNDPAGYIGRKRPPSGKKPIDWFLNQGIGAGCIIYK